MTTVQFFGPSPWCGIVAMLEALVSSYNDLVLDSSWTGDVVTWLLNIDLVRDKDLYILDRIHKKVGDRNLCILGGLFTIELEIGMTN